MKVKTRSRIQPFDWITLSIYFTMIGVGWLMVYVVGYNDGYEGDGLALLTNTTIGRQSIWIAISVLLLFFTLLVEWKFWQTFAYLMYGFGILLLILVLIFGTKINNATSWFTLGPVSFQPSEIAKFGTCLGIAAYLSNFNTNLKNNISQLVAAGFILAPIVLIVLQPDPGSAMVFLAFLIPLYREGLDERYFSVGIITVVVLLFGLVYPLRSVVLCLLFLINCLLLFNFRKYRFQTIILGAMIVGGSIWGMMEGHIGQIIIANLLLLTAFLFAHWYLNNRSFMWSAMGGLLMCVMVASGANFLFNKVLKTHQQERINVWLRPEICDPRGSLYNVLQSKMAIGSGGFQGKGFLEGNMTKLNYVPEQATDFIFCTVGEEQGFIGTSSIILLFFLLIYRITVLAERQRSKFSRIYAYGVAGVLFVHVFINIGMTMGLMPVVGIPLPFISKGGSSLLGFTLLIGVMLKMDTYRELP